MKNLINHKLWVMKLKNRKVMTDNQYSIWVASIT